jgi:Short C-terminal domain
MPFRRRPLATAAMVGGTAYVAGKAGAKAGAANAPAAQQAPPAAQQAPAAAAPLPVEAPPTPAPPAVESTGDKMDQLTKLKQLLDMQALTQEEFDAQKARILASM